MGLAGGSHCLAMCAAPCGALVGRAAAAEGTGSLAQEGTAEQVVQWVPRGGVVLRTLAFHGGRLVGYAAAGALAALAMDSLAWLQGKGMRVATTTGYTRTIMRPLIAKAQALGFAPDLVVCCDDVERSRPDPMGMHACMAAMDLSGQSPSVIKVDDTAPGLAE
eukprot:gene30226-52334_t